MTIHRAPHVRRAMDALVAGELDAMIRRLERDVDDVSDERRALLASELQAMIRQMEREVGAAHAVPPALLSTRPMPAGEDFCAAYNTPDLISPPPRARRRWRLRSRGPVRWDEVTLIGALGDVAVLVASQSLQPPLLGAVAGIILAMPAADWLIEAAHAASEKQRRRRCDGGRCTSRSDPVR